MTRIIVSGDRHWFCEDIARKAVERMIVRYGDICITHGGATGVDAAFDEAALYLLCDVSVYPADWDRLGKKAGPIRNETMVAEGADFVLAVHRDLKSSKGTKSCCRAALKAGIPVYLIDSDACDPRRLTNESPELSGNPAGANL